MAARLFMVEEDVRELKGVINTGFASLTSKLEERGRIQWPAWTLFVMLILAVGAFAYWPIRERHSELKEEVRSRYQEGLERDRRLWDYYIKVQADVARMEGQRGRN